MTKFMYKKIMLTGALAFSLCGHAQLGGLMKKAEKAVKKESRTGPTASAAGGIASKGASPTDGVTSPLHQKYMGKVVFSAANIPMGKENEAAFITSANAGDPIYFRVYMNDSQTNYLQKLLPGQSREALMANGMFKLKYYLDGVECGSAKAHETRFTGDEKSRFTTFRGALRSSEKNDDLIGMDGFARFYFGEQRKLVAEQPAMLSPGDHKFRVDVLPYFENPQTEGPVIASGEITLTARKIVIDPNNPDVCLPKAEMTDKALEAKLIAAFKKNGEFGTDPKELRITSQKWEIGRHKVTGRIINRYLEAAVVTSKNGRCSYRRYDFFQDWDGTGYQENSTYMTNYSEETEISCKCLKAK
jgi:hypothetical protein